MKHNLISIGWRLPPNYWDFILKKYISVDLLAVTLSMDCYFLPLFLGSALKFTLTDSDICLYRAGTVLDYGVYTDNALETSFISNYLQDKDKSLQEILIQGIEQKKSLTQKLLNK